MARLLTVLLAAALLLPVAADAHGRPRLLPAADAHGRSRPLPAAADAHGRRPHRPEARRTSVDPVVLATAVAERYWSAVPCDGQITVLADSALPAELEPTTDGWVTFDSSLGANDLQAPADTYTQCTISLARWQWPSWSAMDSDWNMFCLTMVHEMGHLLGHPHSLVPGSVMAPVFTDESSVPPLCRTTRPRG